MQARTDTGTIRAREVCCIDSTAQDVGCCYNRQLEMLVLVRWVGGWVWRGGDG